MRAPFECTLCGAMWSTRMVMIFRRMCERCEALFLIDLEKLRVERLAAALTDLDKTVTRIMRSNEIMPRVGFKFPADSNPSNPERDRG